MSGSKARRLVPSHLLQIVTMMLILMSSTYSFELLNTTCSGNNLVVSHGADTATQPCAWQCINGECVGGTDLAVNAFLVLFISWGVAALFLWFSTRFTRDEYLVTIFRFLTMLIMVIGILATLGVYNKTTGIGIPIRDLLAGMANSIPTALVFAIVLWMLIKGVEYMFKVNEERGGAFA